VRASLPESEEFQDRDYREAYAEDFLNARVASQIRVLREQREMTQRQLADAIGTKQAGVSRIENVNYSSWNIRTLKKIARALGCRLHISFETYGTLLEEGATFSRKTLQRPKFEDDPAFKPDGRARKDAMRRTGALALDPCPPAGQPTGGLARGSKAREYTRGGGIAAVNQPNVQPRWNAMTVPRQVA
jgi:transcriptional regulator with XRE-family HTH domain